jgi:hypothetical protein
MTKRAANTRAKIDVNIKRLNLYGMCIQKRVQLWVPCSICLPPQVMVMWREFYKLWFPDKGLSGSEFFTGLDYFLFVVWFVGFHPRKPLVKNDLCFIWCNQTNLDTEDASNVPVVWYLLSKITLLTDLKSSQCLSGLEPSNSRVMGTQEREGDISVACSWNVRIQLCGIGTPRIGAKSHYTRSASSGSQSDPV